MATHSFKLYKSLIYETVKNETHITAHATRATESNAAELAYHEEAGDETYHERKLERELYASLDKIKAELIGYLDGNGVIKSEFGSGDASDEITFTIELNSRYNTSYLKPLADLTSKYVEDNMLFEWWTALNQNEAKVYAEHTELDRQAILKCFIKNAPTASEKSYADVTSSVS